MITIKDIAKKANVSSMTVSNVIHNRTAKVSPETIKRVKKIIEEYNYTPNMSARSLVNTSSKLIGFILYQDSNKPGNLFTDPFNTELLTGIEEVLKSNGYYLMVQTVTSLDEIHLIVRNWRMDGVIILGLLPGDVEQLDKKREKPIVLIDVLSEKNYKGIYTVGTADRLGSKLATEYLIQKGHKNIGFVSYEYRPDGVIGQRHLGYLDALETHGITKNNKNNYFYDKLTTNMDQFCEKIIQNLDTLTGLVFTADYLAIEIMHHLKVRGITTPKDISVIGFDNLEITKFITPKLTTISQDIHLKGKEAANILLKVVEKDKNQPPKIEIPVSLVIRESVKSL